MFYGIQNGIKSLEQISKYAWNYHSLEISKQSIDERFSERSLGFVQKLLSDTLESQITQRTEGMDLEVFNTVKIKDSTIIEIDESYGHIFEGFGKGGGPNSKAGMAIQYEFDIKTNTVYDIDLKSAVQKDSKDANEKKEEIKKGDLIIRDLGYYSDNIIGYMLEKEAFFLSKLYPKVSVRLNEQDNDKLNYVKLYKDMIANGFSRLDLDTFIGKKKRPVRMIIVLLPQNVYEKRIRNKIKQGRRNGYELTDEYKAQARFNIFICNIPRDKMEAESVCNLYRIRWQIEIVFKTWKSIMKIDELRKMKEDRFMTTIYAKLLWLFINWKLFSECKNELYLKSNKLLSVIKCFQTLNENSHQIRKLLHLQRKKAENILKILIEKLSKKHWLEKRKNRCNLEDIYPLIFCKLED